MFLLFITFFVIYSLLGGVIMNDLELILPFKDKLRGIRGLEELTMVDLAKFSGLSQSYISQLENGKLPSDENIVKIAIGLSMGQYSKSIGRDTSKDYEKTLKSSRDRDELLNKQKALSEATKRFQFENDFEKDEFLKTLDKKLSVDYDRSFFGSLSDFFGLSDSVSNNNEKMLLKKYQLLKSSNKSKAVDYIDYLLYEQTKKD